MYNVADEARERCMIIKNERFLINNLFCSQIIINLNIIISICVVIIIFASDMPHCVFSIELRN